MERKALEQKVMDIVAAAYGRNVEELTADTCFKEDLKGASIQMVGVVSELENELDVMIALAVASTCRTIGELVDKVEEELA